MPLEVVVAPPVAKASAFDVAAEANHRIANNLSIISGLVRMHGSTICKQPRMMSGPEVGLILEEVSARLDGVARLHRLLAGGRQETTINVADYLRDIAQGIVSSLSIASATELQVASDPGCLVPPERALPLGLIVGELITNAVKYAHPAGVAGRITLACRRRPDGNIAIEISDDGVGLPEGIDPRKNGHMGFRVVRSLADQLGATIAFQSDELGLRCELQMSAS
jgi:two-component sensor histidine kinase